ncbi:putative proline-serine-threonine phosphatase-interacting protein 2 [Blumeria hordei DH14]|uniref:Putative proline-serine-threonine phosphatase-interacting protein 2 n=1 Tax=Blumeria graminis f. sp. hordei (strain DH14) TaxID=546991 RepID=N1JFC8_BLUG1|nr:putative proline-serine-threonine phosphatase-interacting protein 2 [Blumeria hordei DH14]
MPGTTLDGPAVVMSFANNFWGKDDAGVEPLLQRMHNAKQTCDELKSFYSARSAIEEEYSRKLLSLSRKSLGSQETGTLRASMDVLRGEIEQMGKSHQNIASQMKTELEEPLAAFSGAMKERRKIVQSGIEKLHKAKVQQTNHVNKVRYRNQSLRICIKSPADETYQTRDRYEQECLKIKGYLAQGHMVMGQEERRNKAKLEKTQIHLAASNTEYENAVKVLEDTTGRWNRDWKAAADKFQDLEEERLDFTKSSLWSFANIASTVCVSDDASCEKIRLSLEKCEVEKDIASFIKESGTGQEIPDPPRYINFCRGDVSDTQSEVSDSENYCLAQFQRTINPAYRSSSPQPSTYESHHDAQLALSMGSGHDSTSPVNQETNVTPQKSRSRQPQVEDLQETNESSANHQVRPPREQQQLGYDSPRSMRQSQTSLQSESLTPRRVSLYQQSQHSHSDAMINPRDPYIREDSTSLSRVGPSSAQSPAQSPSARSSSRNSQSDLTSYSSHEVAGNSASPTKQASPQVEGQAFKRKSGFFQNHGPFRRRSNKDKDRSRISTPNKNAWASSTPSTPNSSNSCLQGYGKSPQSLTPDRSNGSLEPPDNLTNYQLNVGNNVFDIETSNRMSKNTLTTDVPQDNFDPIAQALAELKGVTKGSATRVSADKYHGIATPAPGSTPPSRPYAPQVANGALISGLRGTPPPSYDMPVQRLGLPEPAFTSKAMQQTKQKYVVQTHNMFKPSGRAESRAGFEPSSQSRPTTRGKEIPRAISPSPRGSTPRPELQVDTRQSYRSASPNPHNGSPQLRSQTITPQRGRASDQNHYRQNSSNSTRVTSSAPLRDSERPSSRQVNRDSSMQMQLAPTSERNIVSHPGRSHRANGSMSPRPTSQYGNRGNQQQLTTRQRSKSVADIRQYNSQGRPILHFARALYMYQAVIPEELSFSKGDVLAILRYQDDGWWEAEVAGKNERPGLVPSNYLQNY